MPGEWETVSGPGKQETQGTAARNTGEWETVAAPPENKTKMDKLRSVFTGEGRTEFPDMGEFDLPFELKGRQAKTALGLMTTFDPKREMAILKENYPDLVFSQDKYGNVIVDGSAYGGEPGYLNKPGFSLRDAADIGFQVAAFTPAGRAAGATSGTLANMGRVGLASGTTQAGLDLTGQATGGTDEVSITNINPTDVMLATTGGAAFEALRPAIARLWPAFKQGGRKITDKIRAQFAEAANDAGMNADDVTDDVIRSWMDAAEDAVNQESIPGVQASKEFGIKYSRGEAMGPGTKQGLKQLGIEDSMRYGAMGPKAESVIKQFDETVKGPSIKKATENVQGRIAGGRATMDAPTQAGETLREGIKSRAASLDDAITQAYDEVGDAYLSTDGLKGLMAATRKAARDPSFIRDPQLAPATARALKDAGELSKLLNKMGDQIRPAHINRIETMRKKLGGYIGSAANPTDKRQVVQLKNAFDNYLDDAVDNALFSGDEGAIEALKKARGLRAEYAKKFQRQDAITKSGRTVKDDAGDVIEKMIAADPTDEQVVNYMFGASKLGGKQAGPKIVERIKQVVGPNSPEFQSIKEAAFLKLTNPPKGSDVVSGRQFANNLRDAMEKSPTLMRALFSKDEIALMNRFANAVKRAQPEMRNPSRSGYKAAEIARQYFDQMMQTIGFTQGGPMGAAAGRGASEGIKTLSGFRAAAKARRATEGAVKPFRDINAGRYGAVSGSASRPRENPNNLPAVSAR